MLDTAKVIGLQVIGVRDGKSLGTVSQVICDLATGDVLGLVVGVGAAEKGVLAQDIQTIGDDAVMVPSASVALRLSELPDLMRLRREPGQGPVTVVTDDGTRLGVIARVWINAGARKVTRYEVSAGLVRNLTEGALILPIIPGTVHGEDTLVVPAEELVALAARSGGLRTQLAKISERVREQASATRDRAERAAQTAREQVGKAVVTVREQVVSATTTAGEAKPEEEPAAGQAGEAPAEQEAQEPEAPEPTADEPETPAPQGEEGCEGSQCCSGEDEDDCCAGDDDDEAEQCGGGGQACGRPEEKAAGHSDEGGEQSSQWSWL